ncbi:Transcriptional activator CadC [Vibrio aerogenes CECT 7868]|uniref:Transcriptional activator CadC n=1 Tax=Vibrio aerogenes CECT 7868 TaxID=1216006 RepID=A0A1M5Z128_9VIBR|nr:transcriptional regulator [Vibrio aerogenes]SHI17593.1 Transcriptional activator CadC [Vibrio aerogenes CECT 7868]
MNPISAKFILAERFTFVPNNNSLIDQENEDEVIRLGTNESRILLMLAQHPNEVIQRNELHDFVWRKQGFEVDDSSLTQAISTLRKMLKDSTKSPRYIKTVPKRGYQLIADVQLIPEIRSSLNESQVTEEDQPLMAMEAGTAESFNIQDGVAILDNPEYKNMGIAGSPEVSDKQEENQPKGMALVTKLVLFFAFIIPVIAVFYNGPRYSTFRHLADVNGVSVNMPKNHPDLSAWIPSIEQCVRKYQKAHQQQIQPSQIIATGGQGNKLVLNYIYPVEYSDHNITLTIGTDQEDSTQICR